MDKESIYLLQNIDCNCNDCKHMERDFTTYKKWEEKRMNEELLEFEARKESAINSAWEIQDDKARISAINIAEKMKFQFNKSGFVQYGICHKFEKQVSFLPGVCQIETQGCFEHRKTL